MDKRFLVIIGVVVTVFVGILAMPSHKPDNGVTATGVQPTSHIEGNPDGKVTLVEYGDYQCPVCEGYFATVRQVQQRYSSTVRFQFRNLPLTQIHPNALTAARAAEAADMQGKFWQMHDLLYNVQNYDDWAYDPATGQVRSADPTPFFRQYAARLGLNVPEFQSDLASPTTGNRVQADIAAFRKTGQQEGTPTFFLNGTYIPNSELVDNNGPSVVAFDKVLDKALKNIGK